MNILNRNVDIRNLRQKMILIRPWLEWWDPWKWWKAENQWSNSD